MSEHDVYHHASLGAAAQAFCVNYMAVSESDSESESESEKVLGFFLGKLYGRDALLCESPSVENWQTTTLEIVQRCCVKRAGSALVLRYGEDG